MPRSPGRDQISRLKKKYGRDGGRDDCESRRAARAAELERLENTDNYRRENWNARSAEARAALDKASRALSANAIRRREELGQD